MAIPPNHLSALTLRVRDWMAAGQIQQGLEEIRSASVLYGESRDDLVRKVIGEALRAGLVQPLPLVSDGSELDAQP